MDALSITYIVLSIIVVGAVVLDIYLDKNDDQV